MKNTWSSFKLRVNVSASIKEVYDAWATPVGLEKWFLRKTLTRDEQGILKNKEGRMKENDTYEWYWYGYPDSVVEKGKILKAKEESIFSFTFSMHCPVTISLYREFDETIVELVESELPTDDETILKHYIGDSKGWIFYLANLKSVLEGGLDLRNRKVELTNVITA